MLFSCSAKPALDFFGSPYAPYYILSPGFTQKSAGPRVLHYLCHTLNELGYEAYMAASGRTNPRLRTPLLTQEILDQHQSTGRVPIAVYPEVVPGNPLQQAVVARWLLNKAGHLRKHKDFTPNELIFYWDQWVLSGEENAERLFFPSVDQGIFNDNHAVPENRVGFCFYAHKYLMFGGTLPEYIAQNGVNLCQEISRSAGEIADILRASQVLYCYEPSAIIAEARACGCPVILVITDYLRQFDIASIGIPAFPEADILALDVPIPAIDMKAVNESLDRHGEAALKSVERFIEITQTAAQAHAEKTKDATHLLNLGIRAFQENNFERAIAVFSDLLEKEPQNPLPFAYLAFIAAEQGLLREADDFIEKSLQISPDRADLKAVLGETFLKVGRPDLAVDYLNEAIMAQPDLLAAYPALAQSLHLTRQSEMAVSLLQSAARMPSPAQANIHDLLLEILTQRGDLVELTEFCLKFSRGMADDLLAARCLPRFESSGEYLLDTLGRIQIQLADSLASGCVHDESKPVSSPENFVRPLKIAFMVGDFVREQYLGRLEALLRFLPSENFMTLLIINDLYCSHNNYANICVLLADQMLAIGGKEDTAALEEIREAAPDILIDLDAYGPTERLAVFLQADAKYKLLWGEAPMPPLSPTCKVLTGARLAEHSVLPCVSLPGMGEYYNFPELPVADRARADHSFILGCLTPAVRIGREGWQLFAEILKFHAEYRLLINLKDLGDAAQDAICARFVRSGVAAERLRFVRAHTAEDFCRLWQEVDLGLAPPVDAGNLALPTCLWMGRPYLALASPLPWARRPAALLESVGAPEWIMETPEAYIEHARPPFPNPEPLFRARLKDAGVNNPIAFAQGFAASIKAMLQNDVS
jgi:Tfp pilus assembly protein PilF